MNNNEADVDELITIANKFYDEAQAAASGVLESAWKSGEALNEAKKKIKHGEWKPWIEANFHGSYQTASDYMRLASNIQRAGLLKYDSIRAALKAIPPKSKPKPKPEPKPAPKADNPVLTSVINELEDQGVQYTAGDVVEKAAAQGVDVSKDTVERKRKAVRAERNAPPVDYDTLPGKVADKWDRVEATLRRKLEREYSTRLVAEVDQIKAQLKDDVKKYKTKLDAEAEVQRAERNAEYERYRTAVDAYKAKGLIPLTDYRLLLNVFHSDKHGEGCLFSKDDLNAAFHIITDPKVKALLVKEK